jgi:hypothetical protein
MVFLWWFSWNKAHLELPSLGKTGYDPVPKSKPSQTLTFYTLKLNFKSIFDQ